MSLARPQNPPGWRILIAGTGGQGVLTIARLLCDCFAERGHQVVSGQLHGLAQRGGAVQSSVLIDAGISPVIAQARADVVIGLEPVETARALPLMSPRTLVYMNTAPVLPFVLAQRAVGNAPDAEYPAVQPLVDRVRSVAPDTFTLDATRLAVAAGSTQALNMVMLGCLLGSGTLPIAADEFLSAIATQMPPAVSETNGKAFRSGVAFGSEHRRKDAAPTTEDEAPAEPQFPNRDRRGTAMPNHDRQKAAEGRAR
jgi:indolepyruvate ferredoxin oxidoreductase beta subunit